MRRLLYVAAGLVFCIGSASQATAGVVDAGDPSINFPGVHLSFDVDPGNGDVTNLTGTVYGNPVTGETGGSLVGPNGYIDFTTSAGNYIITASNGVYSISMPEPSTWAMMALGFAGLVLAGYRAPRKNAVASTS
jgi:PEP-CTERM motif